MDLKQKYILTIDVGTTSIRAFIFENINCKIIGKSIENIPLLFPKSGWVEQDPFLMWEQCKRVMNLVIKDSNLKPFQIKAIGISNQRSSFLTWNKDTGIPLHNIITWQDNRAAKLVEDINNSFILKTIQTCSKMVYFFTRNERFSAASTIKFSTIQTCIGLSWILSNNEEAKKLAKENKLLFGTIDSWLLYNLTGKKVHATDYSNISATGLWDPFGMTWNFVCFKLLGIPYSILPKIYNTSSFFGNCIPTIFENNDIEIPIMAICADQAAAMFGQCCFNFGDIKCTIGTGCFVSINTGSQPKSSQHGLYPLVGWKIGNETTFLLEASDRNAGSILEWLKTIGILFSVSDSDKIASSIEDTNGVYFVPAFSGLNHPYHDDTARGILLGLKRETTKEQIIRAALESIGFRIKDLVDCIKDDIFINVNNLFVDGGVSQNNFLMQFISNILEVTIYKAEQIEMASQGVAFLAGLSSGIWKNQEELETFKNSKKFYPSNEIMNENVKQLKFKFWKKAIERAMHWENLFI